MSETKQYSPGLEGVVAGVTYLSQVDPERQKLAYRGYDIEDLANHSTFEEVSYLLIYGELPTRSQLTDFEQSLREERGIPRGVIDAIGLLSKGNPMDVLRTCVSALGPFDADVNEVTREANTRKAKRLLAKLPTIVASIYRKKYELKPVQPSKDLNHASNLLYMITGREPEDFKSRVFDASLILYAEHSFNASTFTARVIASTLSDMHSAIAGAIGALKGPLHGGANERSMEMMMEIGEPERAEKWVLDALSRKERIMGFGHRVYKWGDSRVPVMKRLGREVSEKVDEMKWYRMSEIIEGVMEREKKLYPNVDFPCGFTYYLLGLPIELYTPIFACSRTAGWAAHVIEQQADNRLIRPDSIYAGPGARAYVPLQERL